MCTEFWFLYILFCFIYYSNLAFKLQEVAEPLMDLKLAIVEIENSKTFRAILSTLLTVGNFLNNSSVSMISL